MEEHDAGIISFYQIASIINDNAYNKTEVTPKEDFIKLVDDLSRYFKTLQNTGFNEKQFKKLCLR